MKAGEGRLPIRHLGCILGELERAMQRIISSAIALGLLIVGLIEQALHSLPAKSFVIDGELVACDAQGRPDFAALHRTQCWRCRNHQLPRSDLFQTPGGPRCLHWWQ